MPGRLEGLVEMIDLMRFSLCIEVEVGDQRSVQTAEKLADVCAEPGRVI